MRAAIAVRMDHAPAVPPMPKPVPVPCPPCYRGARIAASRLRLWHGAAALYLDVRSEGAFEAEMVAAFPRLLFTVEALGGPVSVAQGWRSPGFRGGPLSIVPAGVPVILRGRSRQFSQLVLQFDEATILQPRLMFTDARLSQLCLLLAGDCVSPRPMARLFGDSLVVALLLALASDTTEEGRAVGGLTQRQMLHLESFVEHRLADRLPLESLAREIGVSRSHFGRMFKQTTGHSPFEWLRIKRVERAKQLLADGELPIAQIATAAGFADQAHLTRAFGRLVGLPPGAWQRIHRDAGPAACPRDAASGWDY